jgi:hypothetical protein
MKANKIREIIINVSLGINEEISDYIYTYFCNIQNCVMEIPKWKSFSLTAGSYITT